MLCYSLTRSLASTLLLWPLVDAAVIGARNGTGSCKVIPGDTLWPSQDTWDQLNQTVGGRLIATVPKPAVCHPGGYGPVSYDEAACEALKPQWNYPAVYLNDTGDTMQAYYQNATCNPYYRPNGTCELGNYVSYAINISCADEAAAGIAFAQKHNVRLVIRNTGHDFLGKSTGKGGLSLWTHNLKYGEIIPSYNGSSNYTGPAVKLGAGWTGGQAALFVGNAGYRIVSGDCPTVGLTGGYTQGGGHGLLNGVYGLAADNVLEWEVVTADGKHLTASPTHNSDLYWAMSGGGGGSYAMALGMTTKIHHDGGPVGAATLGFNTSSSPSNATFAEAVAAWWEYLPDIVDTGATALFMLSADTFTLQNVTAPDMTASDVAKMLEPFRSRLNNLNVKYDFTSVAAASYFKHYSDVNGPLPNGVYPTTELFNSRLIPRAISEDPARAKNLTNAMIKGSAVDPDAGFFFGFTALNVKNISHPDNAVVPYWRDAIALSINIAIYDWYIPQSAMLGRRETMANVITPTIEAATYDSGAYLNEADPLVYPPGSLKWKDTFYGSNYDRLRQVKAKWDPGFTFYANTAVGADEWTQDSEGRLCKA